MKSLLVTASVSALLMTAPVWAQSTSSSAASSQQSASAQQLSSQDKQFVKEAGAANLAEVELGQIAMRQATDPAVQEFGRWMMTDHDLANKRLAAITENYEGLPPPTLTSEQKELKQRLQGLQGQQFERQYLQAMVKDHQKDVQTFRKEAQTGQNPEIKTYAQTLVPVLEQHLTEAKALAGAGGVASGTRPKAAGTSGSSLPPSAGTRQLNQHELNQLQQQQPNPQR